MTEACTTATLLWAIAAASLVIPLALLLITTLLVRRAYSVTYEPPKTIKEVLEGGNYSIEARPGAVVYLCTAAVTLYFCVASVTCISVAIEVYRDHAREVCALAPVERETP